MLKNVRKFSFRYNNQIMRYLFFTIRRFCCNKTTFKTNLNYLIHTLDDGKWSEYSQWSLCKCNSYKTNSGVQTRTRTCSEPKHGGWECIGKPSEDRDCINNRCQGMINIF